MPYSRIDLTQYITVPIWYGCNNDCTLCMLADLKNALSPVDLDTFRNLVTDIKNKGHYLNLVLSGAEVTTHDQLERYVRFAHSLGWFKIIQIQTNGRKLRDRVYLKSLIDAGVNEFFISVHGLEDVHDRITRTRGSFSETIAGLLNLAAFDVNVITNTVLTKENYHAIVPLMDFLGKEAVSEIHMWNFFPMHKTDKADLLVSLNDFCKLLPEILKVLKPSNKPLVLKNFPECLSIGGPGYFDSGLPMTLIHEDYWRLFKDNRFGWCIHKNDCQAKGCWGLSNAYTQKYGNESERLSPVWQGSTQVAESTLTPAENKSRIMAERFEYTTSEDVFFDYCLYKYEPSVPFENKFRSINLLYQSFELYRMDTRIYDLIQCIRETVGASYTVWGLKRCGKDIAWEFYFYDYRRQERKRSISMVLEAIEPFMPSEIKANENQPYFMFSIDINNDQISGTKNLENINIYIGNSASSVSSGISYSLTSRGIALDNFYFFFDPKSQMKEILNKVFCSAQIDPSRVTFDELLWPELRNCKTVCAANKKYHDCIYFSGINVDQLLHFLMRMKYPFETISFVENNKSKLDHLQYDVGYDYRMDGDKLVILKSGYYGNF